MVQRALRAEEYVKSYLGEEGTARAFRHRLLQPEHSNAIQNRHQLVLTAALYNLVIEARKMGIPLGLVGGMGTSAIYGKAPASAAKARRSITNIDVHIPAGHDIHELFRRAGLAPPTPCEDLYVKNTFVSRTPYVDAIRTRKGIEYRTPHIEVYAMGGISEEDHKANSSVQQYENHVIASLGLPRFEHRQFSPAYVLGTKLQALSDPNRSLTTSKMDDMHDLIHLMRIVRKEQIGHMFEKHLVHEQEGEEARSNLKALLDVIEDHYELYEGWARQNVLSAEGILSRDQWLRGISTIRRKLSLNSKLPYSPLATIRAKIQLIEEAQLRRIAKELNPREPETRSGILARQVENMLLANNLPEDRLIAFSKLDPHTIAREVLTAIKRG